MVTALDSSVLLDVVTGAASFAEASFQALLRARREGSLIVGEAVVAEIFPQLTADPLDAFLAAWQIRFVPSSLESAKVAGAMHAAYLKRGGRRDRVVPDFLIGAHALKHADRLLARDRGYFRDYFRDLTLLEPR